MLHLQSVFVAVLSNHMVQIEELWTKRLPLGIYGSKCGYLTPCGGHKERYSLLFWDSFAIMIYCKSHSMTALHHLMVEIWELLTTRQYLCHFRSK